MTTDYTILPHAGGTVIGGASHGTSTTIESSGGPLRRRGAQGNDVRRVRQALGSGHRARGGLHGDDALGRRALFDFEAKCGGCRRRRGRCRRAHARGRDREQFRSDGDVHVRGRLPREQSIRLARRVRVAALTRLFPEVQPARRYHCTRAIRPTRCSGASSFAARRPARAAAGSHRLQYPRACPPHGVLPRAFAGALSARTRALARGVVVLGGWIAAGRRSVRSCLGTIGGVRDSMKSGRTGRTSSMSSERTNLGPGLDRPSAARLRSPVLVRTPDQVPGTWFRVPASGLRSFSSFAKRKNVSSTELVISST